MNVCFISIVLGQWGCDRASAVDRKKVGDSHLCLIFINTPVTIENTVSWEVGCTLYYMNAGLMSADTHKKLTLTCHSLYMFC